MQENINFPIWINEAIKLREQNISYKNIAKILNVNKITISYYLKAKGFGPNKKYQRLIQNQPNKKNIKENIFEKIDSEEKAYWLGFLYADGAIGSVADNIELCLKESDLKHIEKFKLFLGSEHKIGKKIKKWNNKEYISYRLTVRNKKIKNDLINLGCTPQKTFTIKFPNNDIVPNKFKKDFIRGYNDGDGSVTNSTCSILRIEFVGPTEFIKESANFFGYKSYIYSYRKYKGSGKKYESYEKLSRLILEGKNAYDFLNLIYKDASIYLDRKYEKYLYFAQLYRDIQLEGSKFGEG